MRRARITQNLENKTNQMLTAVNTTVLDMMYKVLFSDKRELDKNISVSLSSSVARLFGEMKIHFSDYENSDFVLSGDVLVKFSGFDQDSKPTYKIIYPHSFSVKSNGKTYNIVGTEQLCFQKGFYTFDTQKDDIIAMNGNLRLKSNKTMFEVSDKDISLRITEPIAGYRTILGKGLREKVVVFGRSMQDARAGNRYLAK